MTSFGTVDVRQRNMQHGLELRAVAALAQVLNTP
jgi:hypothetical protein